MFQRRGVYILYRRTYYMDLIKPFDQFTIYESIEFMLLHKRDELFSVPYVYRGTAKEGIM